MNARTYKEKRLARNRRLRQSSYVGQVAEYESLLDLFTLITFVLICVAVVFVQTDTGLQIGNAAAVKSSTVKLGDFQQSGGDASQTMPKDLFVIALYNEKKSARLSMMYEKMDVNINEAVTTESISKIFQSQEKNIMGATKIFFAVVGNEDDLSAPILIKIHRWLAQHNCEYKFQFVDK